MKRSLVLSALVIGVLLASGAVAQDRQPGEGGGRLGPPNFGPLPSGTGEFCSSPGLAFGAAPDFVEDSINVSGLGNVGNLDVTLQITHTWVGDITAVLTHEDTTTQALLIDRPGIPVSACGCSGDDIDVVLSDSGTSSVEDECDTINIPAIGGTLTPSPDALSVFAGEDANGDWTMTVADGFAASDSGTFNAWCLTFSQPGDDDTGVPATNTWGVIVLVALFLGASLLFLRRRGSQPA